MSERIVNNKEEGCILLTAKTTKMVEHELPVVPHPLVCELCCKVHKIFFAATHVDDLVYCEKKDRDVEL